MKQQDPTFDRRSKIILGIDDSSEMQMILHATINGAGYTYLHARSPAEALDCIAARPPFDVILLDVQMPEMDGFKLCSEIRKRPQGKKVPIIFLTVQNTVADFEKSKAVGGNAFIVKPFNAKTLIKHLDRWTSQAAVKSEAGSAA